MARWPAWEIGRRTAMRQSRKLRRKTAPAHGPMTMSQPSQRSPFKAALRSNTSTAQSDHTNQVRTGLWPISCDQGCSFWGAALPVLPRQSVIPRSHPPISPGIRTTVAPSSPSMLVLTRRAFFSSLQPSRQWEDSGRPHSVLSAGKTAFCRLAPQHERCSGSTSGSGSGCGCTW
jgi:hypothetical protein